MGRARPALPDVRLEGVVTERLTSAQVQRALAARRSRRHEDALAKKIADSDLPAPVREYRFHAGRRWRFDFAWPEYQLAVEMDGGVYAAGRHTRGAGYEKDCEKGNAAQLDGWTVLHFTPKHLHGDLAVRTIAAGLLHDSEALDTS